MTAIGTFKLWDLKKVITELDYPNLIEEVYASHGEKIWAYQKVPIISQILADQLRNISGDGIVFDSTVCREDQKIALFLSDDEHVSSKLSYEEI